MLENCNRKKIDRTSYIVNIQTPVAGYVGEILMVCVYI